MTRVKIEPGICGFDATVTAESADQMEVTLRVDGGCEAVQKMMQALGGTFDAYELCLTRPGSGRFTTTRLHIFRCTRPVR